MHHATRLFVVGARKCGWQILEDQPNRLHGVGICVSRSVIRNSGLQSMSEAVNAGVCGEPLRHGHHKLRINDRDVWSERVIRECHLSSTLLICQDREGSHLAAGAARSRDRHQACPLSFSFGIFNDPLPQIQKRRGKFLQVRLRRLVLQLHDLCGVDHRSPAQRDDLVRLVKIQSLDSLVDHFDLRLRIRDDAHVNVSLGTHVPPHDVYMTNLL